MSDYNYGVRQASPAGVDAQAIDQGLRTYMISVYQYMTLGLAVTAKSDSVIEGYSNVAFTALQFFYVFFFRDLCHGGPN
jgi:FtsH-binding integral membrane protein